jgi:hypothetical protein
LRNLILPIIVDDTGSSSSDFITSDTSLKVSRIASALDADEKVQVNTDSGTTWVDAIRVFE